MPYRIDRFTIDSHAMVGGRLRVDGYLSRTGVQVYDQGDGTVRREQRDATEVFADQALASFRAMPVTVGHPARGMVDAASWRALTHGHVGDDPRPAEDGRHTKASIWVLDAETQRRVQSRDLTELSVGYFAELDETPGVNADGEHYDARQTSIRGNHVALLPPGNARGGPTCKIRLDAAGNATTETERDRRSSMKFKVRADGYDHEVEATTDALVTALEKERTATSATTTGLEKRLDEALAKLDAELARSKDLAEKLATALDPALVAAAAKELEKVRSDARAIAGRDVEGTTAAEIRVSALRARGVDTTGKSVDYIDARFDSMLDHTPRNDLSQARRAVSDAAASQRVDESINVREVFALRLAGTGTGGE